MRLIRAMKRTHLIEHKKQLKDTTCSIDGDKHASTTAQRTQHDICENEHQMGLNTP
jgi:hypothetical protein